MTDKDFSILVYAIYASGSLMFLVGSVLSIIRLLRP